MRLLISLGLLFSLSAHAGTYAQLDSSGSVINMISAGSDFIGQQAGNYVLVDGIPGAGIGSKWSDDKSCFIPAKPFPSWVIDSSGCGWKAPVDMPTDGARYRWNDSAQTWDAI